MSCFDRLVCVFAVVLIVAFAGVFTAEAQTQPPPADEKSLLEYLKRCPPGQVCEGRVTIPDDKSATLVQPQGRNWQERMEGPVKRWGGWYLVGMLVVLGLFYAIRGRIRVEHGFSGRTIERFTPVERFTHWLTATAFIILGLTGLNIRFGRSVLLPLMGDDAFSWVSQYGKIVHNFTSFAFMLGILMMVVLWIRHNFWSSEDARWIAAGGGMFKRGVHPPARKFNFGQKVIFWSVVGIGVALSWTGVEMLFLGGVVAQTEMQPTIFWHSILAIILIGVIFAHIYIGTLGMEGAFDAMGTGQVDENWAKEHHSLWAAEQQAKRAGGAAE